jgi:hypothetical protein
VLFVRWCGSTGEGEVIIMAKVLLVPVEGAVQTTYVGGLAECQALVGGMIERVTVASGRGRDGRQPVGRVVVLYVNEEGILRGLPVNPRLSDAFGVPLLGQPLHGAGFLAVETSEGDPLDMTEDEVDAWTRMLVMLQPEGLHVVRDTAPAPPPVRASVVKLYLKVGRTSSSRGGMLVEERETVDLPITVKVPRSTAETPRARAREEEIEAMGRLIEALEGLLAAQSEEGS